VARKQHGVVARRQLADLGYSPRSIERRVANGRLHPLLRGVYAVGRPEVTRHGRWMAAVLCGDPPGALSHWSAAALLGIGREGRTIEVSIRSPVSRQRPGARFYRRPSLRPRALTSHQGVPVTDVAQTILDLSGRVSVPRLERIIDEADRLGLTDPERLRADLDEHKGEPGIVRLRSLLGRSTFRLTDSELERRFLALVSAWGLPTPLTQRHVNGFRVDFFWPELGLVVETDGLRYHRTPAQQERDQLRDQAHAAAGLATLRFTHDQVRHRPQTVRETLMPVVARLGAAARRVS
jgi:very-short-patch-repair endonuclease